MAAKAIAAVTGGPTATGPRDLDRLATAALSLSFSRHNLATALAARNHLQNTLGVPHQIAVAALAAFTSPAEATYQTAAAGTAAAGTAAAAGAGAGANSPGKKG